MSKAKKTETQPTDPQTERYHTLMALVRRAENGDETAMKDLKQAFDEVPIIWEQTGNLAAQVIHSLAKRIGGKNLVVREGIEYKCKTMRAELAGPNASSLEALLVDRIVVCWLHLQQAELTYAQSSDMTINQAAFAQKRISLAHNRYLSAVKTLAQVRRLALPMLQVNIGEKQINVAAPIAISNETP